MAMPTALMLASLAVRTKEMMGEESFAADPSMEGLAAVPEHERFVGPEQEQRGIPQFVGEERTIHAAADIMETIKDVLAVGIPIHYLRTTNAVGSKL